MTISAASNFVEPLEPLAEAILLASRLHRIQRDKAERPYILHPLRVMLSFRGGPEDDEARIVAVLHDVVEDCAFSLGALGHYGYSPAVVEAIDAISRRQGESYRDYIVRVSQNPLAARVKIADLEDNLDPARPSTGMLPSITIAKYGNALRYLSRGSDDDDRLMRYLGASSDEEANSTGTRD